ncbi:MAG TPA: alpha/beta hydrolase-fold protein [Polyangia bacterium]|nr:alpha/beta hydrolase-fold protein [Polyangia bacterium]
MTRWSFGPTLAACAVLVIGCGGGDLGGSSGGNGTGGQPQPASGSGGTSGTGGAPTSGSGGSGSGSGGDSDGGTSTPPDGAVMGSTGGSSGVDPGTDGDGIRMLTGPYPAAPEFTRGAGVPAGKEIRFTMGMASTIFPKAPANRAVAVYVPSQYKMGTPAAVMVFQDGTNFYGFDTIVPPVFDNLIAKGVMPPTVGVFVSNGGGDAVGSERGLEYDTVSGLYAAWVDRELLPRVEKETMTALPGQVVTFTKDPEGRGCVGGSSGGAGSFGMVWWHPDLFRRIITFSGTYVNQVPVNSPFPHGCWVYHDKDPYDMTAPNGLIVEHCEKAANPFGGSDNPGPCDTPLAQAACEAVMGCQWNTKVNHPIRIWHESGSNDLGAGGGPATYRNFDLANQRMAASFMKRGYHFHYDHAAGAGHVDGGVLRHTLPEALTYVWRGYRANGM